MLRLGRLYSPPSHTRSCPNLPCSLRRTANTPRLAGRPFGKQDPWCGGIVFANGSPSHWWQSQSLIAPHRLLGSGSTLAERAAPPSCRFSVFVCVCANEPLDRHKVSKEAEERVCRPSPRSAFWYELTMRAWLSEQSSVITSPSAVAFYRHASRGCGTFGAREGLVALVTSLIVLRARRLVGWADSWPGGG